jgi:translocation and assembly module TamA
MLAGFEREAVAFDFFGLFGGDDTPPPASATAISYAVTFDVADGDANLATVARDASSLYKLRADSPPDGDGLARRAMRDFAPLVDALWAEGYYDANVTISVDGASLMIGQTETAAFARAAEAHRNRSPAPVKVALNPGPLFALRTIQVADPYGVAFTPGELPQRIIRLMPGDPARADDLRAAQARVIDWFRAQSHPLAKAKSMAPVVDHDAHVMDIVIAIDPGPKAGFGETAILGPEHFDPAIVRSYYYIEPGDPYSPKALADAKDNVRQIPAVGAVRIEEGTKLDANGNLPLEMHVEDRIPYAIGGSAKYSTIDGPAAQAYWEDRNVFGGAERLRLSADVFYAPPNAGLMSNYGRFNLNDLGGRLAASFVKPAIEGSRNDLLVDVVAEKYSTNQPEYIGYTAQDVDATIAIRHRFSETLSAQIGVEGQGGSANDVLGSVRYHVFGVPVSVTYDTTDSKLDPTKGVRLTAGATEFPRFLGSTLDLVEVKARGSTYYSLDDESRYILAARIGYGSLAGASLEDIPANLRLYAGGGGSVRGYRYMSIGPTGPDDAVVGGRSLLDGSVEARVKVTDTIGFVPFVDAGDAFASTTPDFREPFRVAAGLGLRYYTAIGPIRLDVAAPLNRRPGDPPVAVYVSIGQAF